MYRASLDSLKDEYENKDYLKNKNELLKQLKLREDRQAELFNLLLDKNITKDNFEAKGKTIDDEIESLKDELEKLEKQNQKLDETTLEQIRDMLLSQHGLKNKFLEVGNETRKAMIKNVLWNAEVKDGKLANINFKKPFSLFAKDSQKGSLDLLCAV